MFDLDVANNTILSCLYLFFLIIGWYILTPAAIGQIFNSIAELVIPIEISSKEAKAEIEIHPVIIEPKIWKY